MALATYTKDPNAILDFSIDWTSWLAGGETISSFAFTVDSGLTKDSETRSGAVCTVWLSGGTANTTYTVACRITTSAARTDDRSIVVRVEQR